MTNSAHDLQHIRSLMDRSTRFLSLSGLSGVFAGACALAGAFLAHRHMQAYMLHARDPLTYAGRTPTYANGMIAEPVLHLVVIAVVVLVAALLGATWFTWRRSKRLGQSLLDRTVLRLAINVAIPLAAGGIFCLALLFAGLPGLLAPTTLIFYGLALLNASKYTLDEIRWLGLSELALGLIASFWVGAGLLFWAIGFGVLHIFYGGLMYLRHDRNDAPTDR